MSLSLYDLLAQNVKKMVTSLAPDEKGNIYPLIMHEVERSLIQLVLEETKNNYLRAAKVLGISRSTLYRRIQVLKITKT
jgi:DNA-binding protein Fis